jgi:hypothetical protein
VSARTVVEYALRVYYQDSRDPKGMAEQMLAKYDTERRSAALKEAASEAEGAVALFEDSDEGAAAAGAMEGIAIRYRRMAGEKSTPGGSQPYEDDATHRHPQPCEFPTVVPCICPRPRELPEASFAQARRRSQIAGFFRCARYGRDAA